MYMQFVCKTLTEIFMLLEINAIELASGAMHSLRKHRVHQGFRQLNTASVSSREHRHAP